MKTLLIIIISTVLLSACGSPHERANAYVAKAQESYDAGDYIISRIEAMNAIQIESLNAGARYLLAKLAEQNRNLLQAVYHLRIAIETDPTHIQARLNLGNLYFLARFPELAAEQLDALIILAPENAEVRTLSARVLYQKEDMDAAKKEIDYALELNPLLIEAIIFKAGFLMNEGNADAAILFIKEGIEIIDADEALPLRQFHILLLRTADRINEVETELKALIRDFPDRENFSVSLARLYSSQDMIDKTEIIIQSLIDKFPADMNRRIGFVQFIAENRGLNKAIAVLQEIIAEFPDELILRLLLGRLYEAIDSTDQALATYRVIAETSPASKSGLAARNRIAAYLATSGEAEDAMQLIDNILIDEANNSEALLVHANFNFSRGEFESAIGDLRIVLRADKESENALLLLARSHIRAENEQLAEDAFRRLIKKNPYHPSATIELANLLASNNGTRYAVVVLRQRLEIDPNNREVASALVVALLSMNNLEAAEIVARQMIAMDDPSGLAEYQLGSVLQAKKSNSEAITAYTLALEKDPGAEPPLLGIVEIFTTNEQYDETIQFLETHAAKYPTQIVPKFLIGTIYMQQGDSKAAELHFKNLITEHPDAIQVYTALASLYPDDPDTQINIYLRSLDANPGNLALSMLLAVQYQQSSHYDEAIALYEEILKTDSDNDLVVNNLAVLLLDQKSDAASFSKALQLAKRFSDSPHAAAIDTLGWAYYRTGNPEKAIQYLKIAVTGAAEAPTLRYHLGMAYYSAEKTEPARQELQQAISLAQAAYPGINEARETLDSILINSATH